MSDLDNTALQEKVNEIVTTENDRLLQKKEIIDQEVDGKDRFSIIKTFFILIVSFRNFIFFFYLCNHTIHI